MSNSPKPDLGRLVGGLAFSAIGLFVIVLAATADKTNINGPRWIVTLAGTVFLLGGLAVIKTRAIDKGTSGQDSLVTALLLALLLTSFGGVATWVSLGPGEREFEGSLETSIGWFPLAPGELCGRLLFAPGALLLDGLALYAWVRVLSNLIKRLRVKS